ARGVRLFERDVLDELNVERLEIVPDLDDEIDVSIALDVSDPSALPPGAVSAIRADLAGRDARALRRELLSARRVGGPAEGQAVGLGWGDVEVRVGGRDGFAAAAEREVVVALDTAVTPALHQGDRPPPGPPGSNAAEGGGTPRGGPHPPRRARRRGGRPRARR